VRGHFGRWAARFAVGKIALPQGRSLIRQGRQCGHLNPHEPRRFIPFEKIDEWLNEHHQGEHDL
jgi:hypothetical protein